MATLALRHARAAALHDGERVHRGVARHHEEVDGRGQVEVPARGRARHHLPRGAGTRRRRPL